MNNILVIYFDEIFVLGCGLEWGVAVMNIGRDIIHIDNIIKDYMSEK